MIKILVVEDEKPIADILQYDLKKEEFEVKCAYTGAEGLRITEEFAPHLVLLDWMLPDLSGVLGDGNVAPNSYFCLGRKAAAGKRGMYCNKFTKRLAGLS